MIIHRCEQRSAEWDALRLPRLTASNAHCLYGTRKDGAPLAARRHEIVKLVLQRITGRSQENAYVSAEMEEGTRREPEALAYYEAMTGVLVEPIGFVAHDTLLTGCSPDGSLHSFEGGLEIKNPTPAVHLEFLRTGKIPPAYMAQVIHSIWLTGATFWDFLSFNPAFPESLQMQCQRVSRKDVDLTAHEKLVRAFLAEVDAEEQAVRTMADLRGQLQASLA